MSAAVNLTPLELVLDNLRARSCNPRQSRPGQWESRCPVSDAHKRGDKNPSLSVSEGTDGKVLLHCHAGCTTPDIARALGLGMRDLFPDRPTTTHIANGRRIKATYDYYDADGTLVFQVVRFEPKTFRQRQPDGKGGWLWHTRGIDERPLYQLPQVRAAIAAGKRVWITEGEKDAENLQWHVDGVVTTNAGGAGKWRAEYDAQLAGVGEVTIVHDADEQGENHARLVARHLVALGAHVTVLRPPEGCKDVSEALAYDHTVDDLVAVWDSTQAPEWLDGAVPETEPDLEEDGDGGDAPGVNILETFYVNWQDMWSREPAGEDWLVRPFIAKGRGHALYAGAKTGKSWVTLEVAAALATGREVMHRPAAEPVHVLYLDYEMTLDDLRDRLETFGYHADVDLSHLHYALLPSIPPLDTADGGNIVVEAAQACGAELVVIDTTARAVAGEENDANVYRAFYRHTGKALKAAGIAWLRLDHAGKDATKGQRGSSAKNDDVDLVWRLERRENNALRFVATHKRIPWAPDSFDLTKRDTDDGEIHVADGPTYPTGTLNIVVPFLDEHQVPVTAGRPAIRKLMKKYGVVASNEALRAAITYRRERSAADAIALSDVARNDVECLTVQHAGQLTESTDRGQVRSVDKTPDQSVAVSSGQWGRRDGGRGADTRSGQPLTHVTADDGDNPGIDPDQRSPWEDLL